MRLEVLAFSVKLLFANSLESKTELNPNFHQAAEERMSWEVVEIERKQRQRDRRINGESGGDVYMMGTSGLMQ